VAQRQVRQHLLIGLDLELGARAAGGGHEVVVGQHGALGRAGGARGVDDDGALGRVERGDAGRERRRLSGAERLELVEGHQPVVGHVDAAWSFTTTLRRSGSFSRTSRTLSTCSSSSAMSTTDPSATGGTRPRPRGWWGRCRPRPLRCPGRPGRRAPRPGGCWSGWRPGRRARPRGHAGPCRWRRRARRTRPRCRTATGRGASCAARCDRRGGGVIEEVGGQGGAGPVAQWRRGGGVDGGHSLPPR
jgi:hypothetical protein